MVRRSGFPVWLFGAAAGLLLAAVSVAGDREGNCCQAADSWIREMGGKHRLLREHAAAQCRSSGTWLASHQKRPAGSRERLCNDLVLIWSYKECVYFRDYLVPEAYEPCKAWSRQMYTRCLAGDAGWFDCLPEQESGAGLPRSAE